MRRDALHLLWPKIGDAERNAVFFITRLKSPARGKKVFSVCQTHIFSFFSAPLSLRNTNSRFLWSDTTRKHTVLIAVLKNLGLTLMPANHV